MFSLDERLSLCASFVREGAALADIGTDHAYLPVWLMLNGKIRSAVAADVRKGPLENAISNIEKSGVSDKVTAVLSDGLDNILPEQADDIVIAGMGGELMVKIIDRTEWLRNSDKKLILQPMTRADYLRRYLWGNGFVIESEKACISCGKAYSVMLCSYDGKVRDCSLKYAYIGILDEDDSAASRQYIYAVNEKLKKMLRGYNSHSDEYNALSLLIYKFEQIINKGDKNDNSK